MAGSTRIATPVWLPGALARGTGVPLAGTDCTRYSRIVTPAGAVQVSVNVPACGPLETTCRLVGAGMLDVGVTVGVAVCRDAVLALVGVTDVERVGDTAALPAAPVGVPVGVPLPAAPGAAPVGVALGVVDGVPAAAPTTV